MTKSCLQLHFKSHLTGAQEVPPVDASGCGTLELWFNSGFTKVDYKLKATNKVKLVTQAHLHHAKAGSNGAVIATLLDNGGTAAGPPAAGFNGCVQGTLTATDLTVANTIADLYQKIRDCEVYVNVHTQNNPTGEVRGQVFAN